MQLALFGTVKAPLNKEISQQSRTCVHTEEGCSSACGDIHSLLRDSHHNTADMACGQQVW